MYKQVLFFFITVAVVAAMPLNVKGQFMQDVQGKVVRSIKYTDVQGNPYLFEQWVNGTIRLGNGKSYTNVPLRYDIVSDELQYKDNKSDQALNFIDPVVEFQLMPGTESGESPMIFRNGFISDDGTSVKAYYQVLFDGALKLLKRNTKVIFETREYSSAITTKTFREEEYYYLYKGNKTVRIKKDKKQVLATLADRATELEAFIKNNALNLKNESDLVRLIAHYNSL